MGTTLTGDGLPLCASPPRRRTLGGGISRSTACSTTRSPTASSTTWAVGPTWKTAWSALSATRLPALRKTACVFLRTVRFAVRLGFTIAPSTRAAIAESAPAVTSVAWERIGDEVVKLLTGGGACRGFGLLAETGLLDRILPELSDPPAEFAHTLSMLNQVDRCAPLASAELWLRCCSMPYSTPRTGRPRAQPSSPRESAGGSNVRARHGSGSPFWSPTTPVYWGAATADPSAQAPVTARGNPRVADTGLPARRSREPAVADFCRAKVDVYSPTDLHPPRLADGDLLRLGFAQGPHLATILREVEDAQLADRLKNRADTVAWVIRRWRPRDCSPSPTRPGSSAGEDTQHPHRRHSISFRSSSII